MDVFEVIASAGRNRHLLKINYTKKSTGEVVEHIVEPYSMRGNRFYGYRTDGTEGIRGFIISNINYVEELPTEYIPRWDVEF